MHVQLIFPPQWIPNIPYLSVPTLTAYLEERNIDCRQRDLNLESFDRFLSPTYIERCGTIVLRRIEEIESRERINPGRLSSYKSLCAAALHLPHVLQRIEEAKGVLRSPEEFFQLQRHRWAYDLLKRAFTIISLAHFPSNLNFWAFTTRFNHLSIAGLRSAVDCREENPYLALFEDEFVPEILEDQPALVGISVISDCQLVPAFTLIRALRHRAPGLFIVVGGPFFSKLQKQLPEHPELFDDVNAFVMRDGEEPLYRLCQTLEAGQGLETVPNLVYRDAGGTVHASSERVSIRITELPTPSFDGLPIKDYFSGEPVLPLLGSHGCYWNKCLFCGSFHVYGHRFRMRGAERVLEDMKTLYRRYGCRHFYFSDEALPPALAHAVATAIASEELPFRWYAEARFEKSFDRRRCADLARGGCVKIKFGLESGSRKVLELMNKGTDLDVAREVIAACREAGIAMHFFCMVGFPGETEEDFEATRRFFLDLPEVAQSPGFSFYCSTYGLDKGSDAALKPEILGLEEVRQAPGEELGLFLEFSAPGLPSPEELHQRRWNLIGTVGGMIGTPCVPDEDTHGFLYLAHYDGHPPSVTRAERPWPVPRPLPLTARPTAAVGLVTRRTRPWPMVERDAAAGDPSPPAPPLTWIASTDTDFQVVPLPEEAMEIIRLCDGHHSLEEIVQDNSPVTGNGAGSASAAHRQATRRRVQIIGELLANGLIHLDRRSEEKEDR